MQGSAAGNVPDLRNPTLGQISSISNEVTGSIGRSTFKEIGVIRSRRAVPSAAQCVQLAASVDQSAIKKVREGAHGSFPAPTCLVDHIRI